MPTTTPTTIDKAGPSEVVAVRKRSRRAFVKQESVSVYTHPADAQPAFTLKEWDEVEVLGLARHGDAEWLSIASSGMQGFVADRALFLPAENIVRVIDKALSSRWLPIFGREGMKAGILESLTRQGIPQSVAEKLLVEVQGSPAADSPGSDQGPKPSTIAGRFLGAAIVLFLFMTALSQVHKLDLSHSTTRAVSTVLPLMLIGFFAQVVYSGTTKRQRRLIGAAALGCTVLLWFILGATVDMHDAPLWSAVALISLALTGVAGLVFG